jgi:hypothetical protein
MTTIDLRIDSSTLDKYKKCPRAWDYYHNQKRESAGWRSGLQFGICMHAALALKYKYPNGAVPRPEGAPWSVEFSQQDIMERFFSTAQFPPDDYRTLNYAQEVLRAYNAQYPYEPFVIPDPPEAHVEVAFERELGSFWSRHPGGDETLIRVLWSGRFDLLTEWAGEELWTVDHKTSSRGGAGYFNEYPVSTAQIGYVWAAEEIYGRPIRGFMINALFVRKITKSGQGITFERQKFTVTEEQIAEWKINTLNKIRIAYHDNLYVPNETQCVGRYGPCEYLDVCTQCHANRPGILSSNLYKPVTWSPTDFVED